jgi:heme-degrading monooxygenase HmoA
VILALHVANLDPRRAMGALRSRPNPDRVQGLRYAQTWLTVPLRKGILPSLAVNGAALVTAWDNDESLDRFQTHPCARPYQEGWRVRLDPARSIGSLPGLPDLPRRERDTGNSPVAALTIAKVRANKFPRFALAAGAAEREAQTHPGYIAGFGLMRPATWVATFTLWRDADVMRDYALGSHPGGHLQAMKTDRRVQFHHEMLFARFVPYAAEGQLDGRDPLAQCAPADGVPSMHGIRALSMVNGNGHARVHGRSSGEAVLEDGLEKR